MIKLMMNCFNCTLMKFGFLLLLLSISVLTFSQNKRDFEPLDLDRVVADLDTIKMGMDSTFFYINATYDVLKETVKLYGLKKTIQINSGLILQFVVFCGLYLLWLIRRKK